MLIKPASRLNAVKEYYFSKKLTEIARLRKEGNDIINLAIGSPDLPPHPAVIQALKASSGLQGNHAYQSYRGIPALRQAMANWYDRTYGVMADPLTEVLPLMGSKEGIMHISMAFLEEGTQVLVPNPGYPAYSATARLAGAEVIYYPLLESNWWPDMDFLNNLDTAKIRVMWINYPHMPSGAIPTKALFETLVEWAIENEVLLVNDNPYSLILNQGPPISLLSVKNSKKIALELNSLSKSHNMAGWRVGMLLGHADYINAVLKVKSNMDSGMFKPVQEAAVIALQLDQSWSDDLNKVYTKRRKEAWKIMDLLGATYSKSRAGLFVWGRVDNEVTSVEAFIDALILNAGVFITPGFIFGPGGENYVRISLCADIQVYKKAYSRIEKYLLSEGNHSV